MAVLEQFDYLRIKLKDIISATNNFAEDHRIGEGGFGKVYKGNLLHLKAHTQMAFKRLDRSFGQGDSEFWKEVIMLSVYKHENIISLLGFCDENHEKILVYEHASKGSLDLHLASKDLTWVRRLKIAIGAARGLAYLHNPAGKQQRVLHRDIKSSNILIDENWNAKIADLGLSKFGPANQTITFLITNNAVGTFGYCDPLYYETGLLTKESDVYSFGVVLFEILCGRLCFLTNERPQSFSNMIRHHHKNNILNEIICGHIKHDIHPSSLKVFSSIAFQCLKRDHLKRPSMKQIVTELETSLHHQEVYEAEKKARENPVFVILYTTSVEGIRKQFNDCSSVRFLLKYFKVSYQERDISIHSEFKVELLELLGKSVVLPRLFIKGKDIGGAEDIFQLHEQGKFQPLLAGLPLNKSEGPCTGCAGVRSVVCRNCNGSKTVNSGGGGVRTKCMGCNENGLIKCPICF